MSRGWRAREWPESLRPSQHASVAWGNPLSRGLMVCYPFTESGIGNARFSQQRIRDCVSPAGNNFATLTANDGSSFPLWETAYGERAVRFRSQAYASTTGVLNSTAAQPKYTTAAARVLTTAQTSGAAFTKRHLGNGQNAFYLGMTASSTYSFIAYTSAGTLTASSTTNFSLNKWTTLVGTYDGLAARLFVDGVEVASAAGTGTMNIISSPFDHVIGQDSQVGAGYWVGYINFVARWTRALCPGEVLQLSTNPFDILVSPSPIRRRFYVTPAPAAAATLDESFAFAGW